MRRCTFVHFFKFMISTIRQSDITILTVSDASVSTSSLNQIKIRHEHEDCEDQTKEKRNGDIKLISDTENDKERYVKNESDDDDEDGLSFLSDSSSEVNSSGDNIKIEYLFKKKRETQVKFVTLFQSRKAKKMRKYKHSLMIS